MARFTNPVLKLLDNLYQFAVGAAVAPTQVNTEGEVQLVHDTSREVELAAAQDWRTAGFYGTIHTNDHTAGAGSIDKDDIDPYNTAAGVVIDPNRFWCWLMWAGVGSDTPACIGAGTSLCVTHLGIGKVFAGSTILIRAYDSSVALATAQSIDEGGLLTAAVGNWDPTVLPMILPAGSLIGFRSTALLAGNIRAKLIYWAGPIGVMPPSFY